jgi:hypothetical protein
LADDAPAVKHLALVQLLGLPAGDPQVAAARSAAMASHPIAAILAAQEPEGYWVKPGPGYAPKYNGTVWNALFLEQLGADPGDEGVRRAGEYVLSHCQAESGGLGASGVTGAASQAPSASGETSSQPSAPTPVWRSQMARASAGRSGESTRSAQVSRKSLLAPCVLVKGMFMGLPRE